jgi:hypothetical protein
MLRPLGDFMEKHYKAPWGLSVKLISASFTAGVLIGLWMTISVPYQYNIAIKFLVAVLPSSLLLILWLRRVRSYKVSDTNLVINRIWGSKTFDLSSLEELSKPHIHFLKLKKRLGNSGLFSFTGKFFYPKIGDFQCYVNDWENAVFLKFKDDSLMLSPEPEEDFMDLMSSHLEQNKKKDLN